MEPYPSSRAKVHGKNTSDDDDSSAKRLLDIAVRIINAKDALRDHSKYLRDVAIELETEVKRMVNKDAA